MRGGGRRKPESYARIWQAVSRIPRGRVSTYGAIARLAGFASHARLVGYALHALPGGSPVPWHRVVNAQGRVSLRAVRGRETLQQKLLEREGIRFENGRTDLDCFIWPVSRQLRVRAVRPTRNRRARA
jgi:methylated-DNA-protein-cysteine methyltransferase-like protein